MRTLRLPMPTNRLSLTSLMSLTHQSMRILPLVRRPIPTSRLVPRKLAPKRSLTLGWPSPKTSPMNR